ncbi:EKC/KEOPS complex subunit GON7-like [Rattus rattus]|uniref:EKC/KEOPS complex subunit GON7-like n=1 Tax=Rattus rattus TaxID=10117 RepID=UPI0013F2BB44|nr:EKC/KEOPS complex subunit GON7-like [Rattus rattus]
MSGPLELSEKYVGCDGELQRLQVSCEVLSDVDPPQRLSAGVVQMKQSVVEFLGTLVEQDAQGAAEDMDNALDDDNEEAEGENNSGRTNSDGPFTKRPNQRLNNS